jgi:hypothetical protein
MEHKVIELNLGVPALYKTEIKTYHKRELSKNPRENNERGLST